MWILHSPLKEVGLIYLPGLLAIMVAISYPHLGETSIIYGLLAISLIDSGHVYTTFWRTFFNKKELLSSKKYLYYPILIFLIFCLWNYLGSVGLWKFVVYATLFHHVRQVYGISKWYQVLNKRNDLISDFFLYALSTFPILIYHFRPEAFASYYSPADLFLYPNIFMTKILTIIFLMVISSWILYEVKLWKKGIKENNRILSIAYPALVYGYCFLFGKTITQILFPLFFVHGISYMGIIGMALNKTQRDRFRTFSRALLIVFLTAISFGLAEKWYEAYCLSLFHSSFLESILIGFYLTPLFCHYYFDSIIWKKSHRESREILTAP